MQLTSDVWTLEARLRYRDDMKGVICEYRLSKRAIILNYITLTRSITVEIFHSNKNNKQVR